MMPCLILYSGRTISGGKPGISSRKIFSSCLAFPLEIFRTITVFSYFDRRNELGKSEPVVFSNAKQFLLIFLRKMHVVPLGD